MLKNIYVRLALISTITTLAILVVLPRIPIKLNTKLFNLDAYIGGYNLKMFNGKVNLDLRSIKKGLDLAGGVKVTLRADMSKIPEANRNDALESAKQVIERRVNLLGVSEPYVATSRAGDEYRINVELPGVEDLTQAINLIGQTAQLKFKQLKKDVAWDPAKYVENILNPTLWEDSGVTGADLKGADVVTAQGSDLKTAGRPQIRLRFTDEGRQKFSEVAKANVNKPIALFLDEGQAPISAPTVDPDLAKGLTDDPVINGSFTFDQAKNLSIQIRAGALPIPVEVLAQETVGATLGSESIHKSFYAGVVGLILVFVFMVFKYGRLGLLAGFSLTIYSFITLAIFKLFGVVLTLPGIAGFILSIGMATDANILIFERIKEELFWGKPQNLAIKLGFERAWNSIRDSNISSLITSFILFRFGDGPIRGFALTLAVGIFVSLFTSIFVVKTLVDIFNFGKVKNANN